MEEVKTMTAREVLVETVKILSGISVPAPLSQTIGVPICNSIVNINVVIEAMDAADAHRDAKKESEGEPNE